MTSGIDFELRTLDIVSQYFHDISPPASQDARSART
jgi:hypothetical protein